MVQRGYGDINRGRYQVAYELLIRGCCHCYLHTYSGKKNHPIIRSFD